MEMVINFQTPITISSSFLLKQRSKCKEEKNSLNIKVRAADMPIPLQNQAFRCAKDCLDSMPNKKLDSKRLALALKKVWSLVRRFDQPQKYKPFISRCVVQGDLEIGSVREVNVKSGLPATTSTERLELLDDEEHILSIRIVGGDHRLQNYSSIITLHPEIIDGRPGTLVIESFVVDVPEGNTKDETCYFVEALIKCNLKSLADVSERLAVQDRTEPIERL